MFHCILEPGGKIEITVLRGDGEFIVRIPVGFVDGDDLVVSLFVSLSPLIGSADLPGFELVFSLVTASALSGAEVQTIWDGQASQALMPEPEHRRLTRDALSAAVRVLIDEAQPRLVSMTTHGSGLPKRALAKFDEIASVFGAVGFEAGRADPWHGHHIWMMQRPD